MSRERPKMGEAFVFPSTNNLHTPRKKQIRELNLGHESWKDKCASSGIRFYLKLAKQETMGERKDGENLKH